jgi:arsenate reductase-like glutaredoxin family protein
MLTEAFRLLTFGANIRTTPEAYFNPTVGVTLADISPCYSNPTLDTKKAMASDFEVNNINQVGGYAAEPRTKDELSIALSSATEHHVGSSNRQIRQLDKVQVSQIIIIIMALTEILMLRPIITHPVQLRRQFRRVKRRKLVAEQGAELSRIPRRVTLARISVEDHLGEFRTRDGTQLTRISVAAAISATIVSIATSHSRGRMPSCVTKGSRVHG